MVGVTSVSVVTNVLGLVLFVPLRAQLHQHAIFLELMLAWVGLGIEEEYFLGAKSISTRLSIISPKNVI
jgi:hypothetical protein